MSFKVLRAIKPSCILYDQGKFTFELSLTFFCSDLRRSLLLSCEENRKHEERMQCLARVKDTAVASLCKNKGPEN